MSIVELGLVVFFNSETTSRYTSLYVQLIYQYVNYMKCQVIHLPQDRDESDRTT